MNWFFQEGRRSSGQGLPGTPSAGAADTGRTEQTYREWARRFHLFMKEKELEGATVGAVLKTGPKSTV